jgi:hypothetical protein
MDHSRSSQQENGSGWFLNELWQLNTVRVGFRMISTFFPFQYLAFLFLFLYWSKGNLALLIASSKALGLSNSMLSFYEASKQLKKYCVFGFSSTIYGTLIRNLLQKCFMVKFLNLTRKFFRLSFIILFS